MIDIIVHITMLKKLPERTGNLFLISFSLDKTMFLIKNLRLYLEKAVTLMIEVRNSNGFLLVSLNDVQELMMK